MGQQEIDIVRGGRDLMSNFRQEMDRLFSQFMGAGFPNLGLARQGTEGGRERAIAPPTDISEDENAYRIIMEMPGIDQKELEVNVSGQMLTVRAQQQQEQQEQQQREGRNYILTERSYGTIQRQFRIPDDVDTNSINAEFRNGILALTLQKSQQAQQQRRRIEVKSA